MHYLNLMTIRLYTLLALLPNRFLNWLQHSFNLTRLPASFPNLSNFDNGQGSTIVKIYQQHPDVAKFYINFGKYLRPTRPIYTVFANITGKVAEFLYDITNDLERAYVSLFKLFGLVSSESSIGHWYKYVQYAGFAVFMLLLVIYGVGMIFSLKGGFARMKNLIVGTMIATAFIGVLPLTMNAFSSGIQKVADYFVGGSSGNNTQSMLATGSTSGKGSESVGDSIVRNNVVSIPSMTTYAGEHGQNDIDINSTVNRKAQIFTPTHQQFSSQIPEQSYYVNLYHMPNDEKAGQTDVTKYRDAWNGIGDGSTADFLGNVGGNGSYLDKNTIQQNITAVQTQMHDNPSLVNQFNAGLSHFFNGAEKFGDKLLGTGLVGSNFSDSDQSAASAGNYTTDYNNYPGGRFYLPYQYFIQGSGSSAQFKPLGQFGSGSSFGTGFHQSYANYSINWFNIYLGLITLICLLLALIVKVTNSFYKLVVMYVTSGWFLMKNAAQHDKIKDFIKAFFGIFENLVLDMLFLRLFIIVYLDVNSAIARLPFSPILLGIIQVMATIGLFNVENKGFNTISQQISGQNNQTGNGFGSLAAAATAGLAGRGVGRLKHYGGVVGRGTGKTGMAGYHTAKGFTGGWQRHRNQMHPNDHNPNTMQRAGNKLGNLTGSNGGRTGDGDTASTEPGNPGDSNGNNSNNTRTSSGHTPQSGSDQRRFTNASPQRKNGSSNVTRRPGSNPTSGHSGGTDNAPNDVGQSNNMDTSGPNIDNTPRRPRTPGEKVGSALGYLTRGFSGRTEHAAQQQSNPDFYATGVGHSNSDDRTNYHYTGHPGNTGDVQNKGSQAQKMKEQQEKKRQQVQQRHADYRQKNMKAQERQKKVRNEGKDNQDNPNDKHSSDDSSDEGNDSPDDDGPRDDSQYHHRGDDHDHPRR